MKTVLRTIIGISSVSIWMYAAYFALKWFGHMADGTISYNGRTSAVVVPALSGLVLLGAVCSVILFIMTRYGKIRPFWTTVMMVLGTLFWFLIQGG
ncbi:MAG: hypothetical protein FVQ84_12810 [Planctomycetes bacterium]|nr:hypothetical protein [Planctomycetota bacterium]